MGFKGKIIISCPPSPLAKAELFQPPPPPPTALLIIVTTPTPTPPHTNYNVTVEDEKLENRLRYLLSDNPACAGRFLREEYKPKPHDYGSNRVFKREANRILDKILPS